MRGGSPAEERAGGRLLLSVRVHRRLPGIVRLNAFSADPQYCAGKVAVASDPDGAIARSYGLTKMDIKAGTKDSRGVEIDHDFTERTTFVVGQDGKVAATFSTADDKVSPADHVNKSLAAVQQLRDH